MVAKTITHVSHQVLLPVFPEPWRLSIHGFDGPRNVRSRYTRHVLDVLVCPVQVLPVQNHGASRLNLCSEFPPRADNPSLVVELEVKEFVSAIST